MNAVPKYISAREVVPSGSYVCPLCKEQTTSDSADTGWAFCPMVSNSAICLGCCLDHQKVAASSDFDQHPFWGLFHELSKRANISISILRQTCLEHQEAIVRERLDEYTDEHIRQKLLAFLSKIRIAGGKR